MNMQTITSKDCAIRLQSFSSCSRIVPLHILKNSIHHTQDGKAYLRCYLFGAGQRVHLLECVHPFILSASSPEYIITCINNKVSIKQKGN